MEWVGRGVKTADQAFRSLVETFQICLADPQNNPFVGLFSGVEDGLVKLHGVDENQISILGMIQLALHPILHLATEEKVDFKKIMVVNLYIRGLLVPIVKNFIIGPAHVLARIEQLGTLPHTITSKMILAQELQCVKQSLQFPL